MRLWDMRERERKGEGKQGKRHVSPFPGTFTFSQANITSKFHFHVEWKTFLSILKKMKEDFGNFNRGSDFSAGCAFVENFTVVFSWIFFSFLLENKMLTSLLRHLSDNK